jgi:hemerythrin-like domain-containing protein
MTSLPDPNKFEDPIAYFRASHAVVLGCLNRLSALADQAAKEGTLLNPNTNTEWADLLHFFSAIIPTHEKDEEKAIFPMVMQKVPHTGFQPEHSSLRFVLEGHEVLTTKAEWLVKSWKSFAEIPSEKQPALLNAFVESVAELVTLYHEHIKTEEELVYSKANELLTPDERQVAMAIIRNNHAPVLATGVPTFDPPTTSMPLLSYTYGNSEGEEGESVEAVGEQPNWETEEEEGDDEEEEPETEE